jgi:hypothetical protein
MSNLKGLEVTEMGLGRHHSMRDGWNEKKQINGKKDMLCE